MDFVAPSGPAAMLQTSEGRVALPLDDLEVDATKTTVFERRFNPYDFNGG